MTSIIANKNSNARNDVIRYIFNHNLTHWAHTDLEMKKGKEQVMEYEI